MPVIRFNPRRPGSAGAQIQREILARLRAAPVGERLVAQAKRRIRNSGDSTVTYPDLWASGVTIQFGSTPGERAGLRRKRKGQEDAGRKRLTRTEGKPFRAGGTPLRDTGALYSTLDHEATNVPGGRRWALTTPMKHALMQQAGYSTKGPNFIPLTKKARRNWTKLKPLKKAYQEAIRRKDYVGARRVEEQLDAAGLIEGTTYIMAWKGVTVPARPIFNLPPEDRAEIRATVRRSLKRRRAP